MLISQYTRETEEGLRFARSDDASSHQTSGSSSRKDSPNMGRPGWTSRVPLRRRGTTAKTATISTLMPLRHTVQPYDYEQNYPADEHVRMMNAYVRAHADDRVDGLPRDAEHHWRGELGGTAARRAGHRRATRSPGSWAGSSEFLGSEPRSRPTSMSAQAELLAGMFGARERDGARRAHAPRRYSCAWWATQAMSSRRTTTAPRRLASRVTGYAATTTGSKDSKESKESTDEHVPHGEHGVCALYGKFDVADDCVGGRDWYPRYR